MNSWILINIILNLITLINTIITMLICLFIFLLVIIFHRQTRSVPLLLACYTCFILFFSSFLLGSMVRSSLYGFLSVPLVEHSNTCWCLWRGFLIHAILCVLYDSYVLQAIYRLCRVVFHRSRYLHRYSLYCCILLIETFFGISSISPVFIQGHVRYLASEFYCQTPFSNISAILYIALRLFLVPLILISLIYLYLVNYLHQIHITQTIAHRRHRRRHLKSHRRNLIIIRRILLMLAILILLGLPSIVFLVIFIINGHLASITYRVGWLSVSFSLVFLAYMLIQLTRPLRKTIRKFHSCTKSIEHRSWFTMFVYRERRGKKKTRWVLTRKKYYRSLLSSDQLIIVDITSITDDCHMFHKNFACRWCWWWWCCLIGCWRL